MAKDISTFIKLSNSELYSAHCLRRSPATSLFDSVALKHHGRWRSTISAEGYADNSKQNSRDSYSK